MAIEDFIKVLGIGQKPADQIIPDSNVPYQLRGDFQEEQEALAPMPEVPGQFKLPGDSSLNEAPVDQSMFDRTSELVQGLLPGESSGIPQKTGKRNDILSTLSGLMNKKLSSEEAPVSAPVEATPYQKQDLMGNYAGDLDKALADRQRRMSLAQMSGGATDIIAAGNRMIGLKDDRRGLGDAAAQRMEDIELKDFNERMGLSGKVLGSRKAEQDLSNMGDLNDPNSPITQALRKGAKEYLGGKIDDSVLNSLSGVQLAQLNDELGGVFGKIEDRKFKERQLAGQEEDRRFNRSMSLREMALKEKQAEDNLDPTAKMLLADELKEKQVVKKENRKERYQIEKDLNATENLVNLVKQAKDEFEKYSKGSLTGTGPLATLGGGTKYLSSGTQKLDSLFRTLSLDSMVKMFSGMSKAVDTNAERAAFEATQPSLSNDDNVNKMILDRQLKAAESLLRKQKEAIGRYDKQGNFDENTEAPSTEQQSQPQGKYAPGTQLRVKGKMYRVGADGNSLEEI